MYVRTYIVYSVYPYLETGKLRWTAEKAAETLKEYFPGDANHSCVIFIEMIYTEVYSPNDQKTVGWQN